MFLKREKTQEVRKYKTCRQLRERNCRRRHMLLIEVVRLCQPKKFRTDKAVTMR